MTRPRDNRGPPEQGQGLPLRHTGRQHLHLAAREGKDRQEGVDEANWENLRGGHQLPVREEGGDPHRPHSRARRGGSGRGSEPGRKSGYSHKRRAADVIPLCRVNYGDWRTIRDVRDAAVEVNPDLRS